MSSTATAPTTDASLLTTGLIPAGRLGSGTADATTFPRGDRTWAVPAGGGGSLPTTGTANRFLATPDGSDGAIALRNIAPADVPSLATSKITGLDAALAAKAPLASPPFTGTPTAPTATGGTNSTQLATCAFVRSEVAALVNSAPGTLDTLGEIATQLASDESAAAALVTTVGGKLAKASNLSDLTDAAAARTNLVLATVAATGSASDLATGTLANARTTGTSANTANTLVLRGASGEINVGAIHAATSYFSTGVFTGTVGDLTGYWQINTVTAEIPAAWITPDGVFDERSLKLLKIRGSTGSTVSVDSVSFSAASLGMIEADVVIHDASHNSYRHIYRKWLVRCAGGTGAMAADLIANSDIDPSGGTNPFNLAIDVTGSYVVNLVLQNDGAASINYAISVRRFFTVDGEGPTDDGGGDGGGYGY